jgi:hypothetical protein
MSDEYRNFGAYRVDLPPISYARCCRPGLVAEAVVAVQYQRGE